jgi:hypothetical protein
MKRNNSHRVRLAALEALLKPKGQLLVFSTPEEAERVDVWPSDLVVVTGVPRRPIPTHQSAGHGQNPS